MKIPDGFAGLDRDWLSSALRRGGAVRRATVASLETAPLATGAGLFGQLGRLRVGYDVDEPGAPRAIVAKLSSASPEMRARPATVAAYAREVRFYRSLADRVPVRTPRCYYADFDSATGLHVLLLEDLAPARTGAASAPCSRAHAELAVREAARLHAAWWERPELAAIDWLPEAAPDADAFATAHAAWWPVFLERAGHALPGPVAVLGARLGAERARLARRLSLEAPRTLVHGDYKLENLAFATPDGGVPFAVLDWQLLRRGRGVFDVAYLLGQGLDPDARRAWEDDLLALYHATLEEGGVRNHPFAQCLEDYRLSLLARFGALISTIAAMPLRDEDIRHHVDVLLPRIAAALTDHDVAALVA